MVSGHIGFFCRYVLAFLLKKAFLSLVHNAILHQTTGKVMSLGMKQFFYNPVNPLTEPKITYDIFVVKKIGMVFAVIY